MSRGNRQPWRFANGFAEGFGGSSSVGSCRIAVLQTTLGTWFTIEPMAADRWVAACALERVVGAHAGFETRGHGPTRLGICCVRPVGTWSTLACTHMYIATYCAACGRASLAPRNTENAPRCPTCDQPSRAVPGTSYDVADLPLFAEIEAVVFDAKLTLQEAGVIALELALEGISRSVSRIPTLFTAPLEPPTPASVRLGMLRTAVVARIQ